MLNFFNFAWNKEKLIDHKRILHPFSEFMFLIFVANLVLPFLDIPVIDISLTTPIIILVFFDLILRRKPKLGHYSLYFILVYFFLMAVVASIALGDFRFSRYRYVIDRDFLSILRYAFWVTTFLLTTVILSSHPKLLYRSSIMIALCILVIAGLRCAEFIIYGNWGSKDPVFLTQNSYAFLFSSFIPFLYGLYLFLRPRWYPVVTLAILVSIIAMVGNVSRGAWVAVSLSSLGFFLSLIFYFYTQKSHLVTLIFAAIFTLLVTPVAILFVTIDSELTNTQIVAIRRVYNTFLRLEQDKSAQIRVLMVQKGLKLFNESPYFGVGIGRFSNTYIQLDLGRTLKYGSQLHFNHKGAHNSYIQILTETGLAGIIPFGLLLGNLLLGGMRFFFMKRFARYPIVIPIFWGFIGMAIHMSVISAIENTATWFVYAMMAACIIRYLDRRDAFSSRISQSVLRYE